MHHLALAKAGINREMDPLAQTAPLEVGATNSFIPVMFVVPASAGLSYDYDAH
jgi:hypothetical protein